MASEELVGDRSLWMQAATLARYVFTQRWGHIALPSDQVEALALGHEVEGKVYRTSQKIWVQIVSTPRGDVLSVNDSPPQLRPFAIPRQGARTGRPLTPGEEEQARLRRARYGSAFRHQVTPFKVTSPRSLSMWVGQGPVFEGTKIEIETDPDYREGPVVNILIEDGKGGGGGMTIPLGTAQALAEYITKLTPWRAG